MLVQQNVQMRFVAESIRRIVGCGDSTHRCRDSGTKSSEKFVLQTVGTNFVRLLKIRTKFRLRIS